MSKSAGVVATALAFGIVLLGLAYAIGPISGCHVNPAVTIGFVISGQMPIGEAIGYWIAQFLGGDRGRATRCGGCSPDRPSTRSRTTGLGTDGWGKDSMVHLSAGAAFGVEVIMTLAVRVRDPARHQQGGDTRLRRPWLSA